MFLKRENYRNFHVFVFSRPLSTNGDIGGGHVLHGDGHVDG